VNLKGLIFLHQINKKVKNNHATNRNATIGESWTNHIKEAPIERTINASKIDVSILFLPFKLDIS